MNVSLPEEPLSTAKTHENVVSAHYTFIDVRKNIFISKWKRPGLERRDMPSAQFRFKLPGDPVEFSTDHPDQEFRANGIQLEPELELLVGTLISEINGCGFCVDLAQSEAIRENLGMEKFNALAEYQTSPRFSDRERAALAYVEEITRQKNVSDATFEELRTHFTDRKIVELTWMNVMENYNNLVNIPLEIESDGLCAIAKSETQMEQDEQTPVQNVQE